MGNVTDISEIHAASIFMVEPEDGEAKYISESSMYVRNVGNIVHIQTV